MSNETTDATAREPPDVSFFDGVGPFLTFWRRHTGRSPDRIADTWQSGYHDLLPTAVQRSLERHRFPGDVHMAMPRMVSAVDGLGERREAVRRAAIDACGTVSSQMDVKLAPFRLTTLVGLFGADGWMEWEDDIVHLLIAVEALESIEQAKVLIHHEVVHVVHQQFLADEGIRDVGDALFEEGLATAVPGTGTGTDLDAGTLCWAGRQTTSMGESVADWLARCEAAWPAIRSRLLADFASTTDEAYGTAFLGGDDEAGIPPKAGYYAGLRLVRRLLDHHTLPEVAHWDRDVARFRTRATLAG